MAVVIDKVNKGIAWKNEAKDGVELHPDAPQYSGGVNIKGTQMRVAVWVNRDDDGNVKHLSLDFRDQEQTQAAKATTSKNYDTRPKPVRDDV